VWRGEGEKEKGDETEGGRKTERVFLGRRRNWENGRGELGLDREVGMTMGVGQVGVLIERRHFHYCHEQNE